MTNPNLTAIQAIIDRSGSMEAIRTDAEAGFNSFLERQRQLPGDCLISLSQFDDEHEVVYRDIPLSMAPPLSIVPRGSTALLDAIGRTVNELGQRLAAMDEDDRPSTVIVAIVTDGLENASKEFSYEMVQHMIHDQEQVYSWTFLFLAAGKEAVEQGHRIGIDPQRTLDYNPENTFAAYDALAKSVTRLRSAVALGGDPASAREQAAFTDAERDAAQ